MFLVARLSLTHDQILWNRVSRSCFLGCVDDVPKVPNWPCFVCFCKLLLLWLSTSHTITLSPYTHTYTHTLLICPSVFVLQSQQFSLRSISRSCLLREHSSNTVLTLLDKSRVRCHITCIYYLPSFISLLSIWLCVSRLNFGFNSMSL